MPEAKIQQLYFLSPNHHASFTVASSRKTRKYLKAGDLIEFVLRDGSRSMLLALLEANGRVLQFASKGRANGEGNWWSQRPKLQGGLELNHIVWVSSHWNGFCWRYINHRWLIVVYMRCSMLHVDQQLAKMINCWPRGVAANQLWMKSLCSRLHKPHVVYRYVESSQKWLIFFNVYPFCDVWTICIHLKPHFFHKKKTMKVWNMYLKYGNFGSLCEISGWFAVPEFAWSKFVIVQNLQAMTRRSSQWPTAGLSCGEFWRWGVGMKLVTHFNEKTARCSNWYSCKGSITLFEKIWGDLGNPSSPISLSFWWVSGWHDMQVDVGAWVTEEKLTDFELAGRDIVLSRYSCRTQDACYVIFQYLSFIKI